MMLAASCATGQGGSAPPDMPRAFGEVTRVPDGDTIDVATSEGTVTVRLAAINAPDRGECQAEEARAHLRDAFPDGSARLEILGTDQFDRTVGHVFDGDRHINLEMVAMGLALASTPDDADPYGATILEAEEGAYREGAGLWGPAACGASADLPALGIDGAASEPDPAGPDDEHLRAEYIVISNSRDSPVDLDGWTIRDESSLHSNRRQRVGERDARLHRVGSGRGPGLEQRRRHGSPPRPRWGGGCPMEILRPAPPDTVYSPTSTERKNPEWE
jgi:endonuclease YncB( thermonuclease family)